MGATIVLTPTVAPTIVLTPQLAPTITLTPSIGTAGPTGGTGGPGPPGSGGDLSSVFAQSIALAVWVVPVPPAFIATGKVPACATYDTAGSQLYGTVFHDAVANTMVITFSAPTAGTVSLN